MTTKTIPTAPCSILEVGGFPLTGNPLATNFGLSVVGRPGERFPVNAKGIPLQFICQFNLTEAPFVPDALEGLALITVFVDSEDRFLDSDFRRSWCIRGYPSLDRLVPVTIPEPKPGTERWLASGAEGRWVAFDDPYPRPYELVDDYEEDEDDDVNPLSEEGTEVGYRTKLGGFPSPLQRTPPAYWGGEFAFQIDSEKAVKLNWIDGGIVYVYRNPDMAGTPREWSLDCQFL
jgi:hypothetical protein